MAGATTTHCTACPHARKQRPKLVVDVDLRVIVSGPHLSRVSPKVAGLLHLLVKDRHPQGVRAERAIRALWAGSPPANVRQQLWSTVAEAREALRPMGLAIATQKGPWGSGGAGTRYRLVRAG